MKTVKQATFIWYLILIIFQAGRNVKVAMINPFTLNILTLKDENGLYQLSKRHYNHEARHIAQVKEEGRLKFIIKYLFYNLKYGYRNNPYEVDARKYETI